MPQAHTALNVGVEEDLLPLSALLHQHGVAHRIFEKGGRQVVTVGREDQAQQVKELYRAWREGEVKIELRRRDGPAVPNAVGVQWRRTPVTLTLILLSVCGFLLVWIPAPVSWISYLAYSPVQVSGDQLLVQNVDGQYWRLVTPVFLHFGWLHIVFNSLWLWELGRQVEKVMGHFNMFMLFLFIAIVSTVSQFAFGGGGLFGGMSGVVYGLLGFSWVAPMLQPAWAIQPSSTLMLFMVGWLVVCMVGVVEVLGFGAIANAAHVGGLLSGVILGALFGGLSRRGGDSA
jgi:GlpG protein